LDAFSEYPTETFHTSLVELERLRENLIGATLHNKVGDFTRYRKATLVFYQGKRVEVKEYTILEPSYLYTYANQILSVI